MSLVKGSFWFAVGTMMSRLSGVLRESVVAGIFGASVYLDAFFIANRIPNMLRELLAEGALGASFTKVYTQTKSENSQQGLSLVKHAFGWGGLLAVLVSFVGVLLAPVWVNLLTISAPSTKNGAEFLSLTVTLTRWMFPFIGFMIISALCSGVLHERGRFFNSAVASVALNIGYMGGALWLGLQASPADAIWYLVLGVLMGGLGQVLVQMWGIPREIYASFKNPEPLWPVHQKVKEIFTLMLPMALAASAGQINVLVNTNFASALGAGSVSWLNYAFRILQLPIGLFAVGVGNVVLPQLARDLRVSNLHDKAVWVSLGVKLDQSLQLILWVMSVCCAFMLSSSDSMVRFLYVHGRFTEHDAQMTSHILAAYSCSLMGYGAVKVLTSFYYVLDKTSFALKVSLFSIFMNVILNAVFVHLWGVSGLALTFSVVITFNAFILLLGLTSSPVSVPFFSLFKLVSFLCLCVALSVYSLRVCNLSVSINYVPLKINIFLELMARLGWIVCLFSLMIMAFYRKSPMHFLLWWRHRRM